MFPAYPTGHVPVNRNKRSVAEVERAQNVGRSMGLAGSLQFAIEVLPALEMLSVGQFWQVLEEVCPSIALYFPGAQLVQAPDPCDSLYVPT